MPSMSRATAKIRIKMHKRTLDQVGARWIIPSCATQGTANVATRGDGDLCKKILTTSREHQKPCIKNHQLSWNISTRNRRCVGNQPLRPSTAKNCASTLAHDCDVRIPCRTDQPDYYDREAKVSNYSSAAPKRQYPYQSRNPDSQTSPCCVCRRTSH